LAPVQNWFPWKAKLNAPEPIAALVNGVQVTAGEYTSSAMPGPPFGVPHWGSRHFRAESDAKQVLDIALESLGISSHLIDFL